jgi:hypothetical protein
MLPLVSVTLEKRRLDNVMKLKSNIILSGRELAPGNVYVLAASSSVMRSSVLKQIGSKRQLN